MLEQDKNKLDALLIALRMGIATKKEQRLACNIVDEIIADVRWACDLTKRIAKGAKCDKDEHRRDAKFIRKLLSRHVP